MLQMAQVKFKKIKDLTASLERGKRYLKTQFQLNCCDDSPVRSHNIAFALSDPQNISFQKTNSINLDGTCDDCNNILFVMEAVQKIINENSENQDLQ